MKLKLGTKIKQLVYLITASFEFVPLILLPWKQPKQGVATGKRFPEIG